MTIPVMNTHDGVVRATDPPSRSVWVYFVIGERRVERNEVWIGATTSLGRADLIVRSADGRLRVILGDHGATPAPSWHLVQSDDALLAAVMMPPHTSTVLQTFIQDCRAFGGSG